MTSNVRSSLVYELFIHAHRIYSVMFFIAMIFIYFYKGSVLPYQYHVRVLELLIILAFAPIEAIRLSWGSRGNLTETPVFLGFSILLSVPLLLILLYLAVFQNYVHKRERLGKHSQNFLGKGSDCISYTTLFPVFGMNAAKKLCVLLIEAIIVGVSSILVIIETIVGLALCATLSTGSS
ncbi:hypothetical protein RB195_019411 [Necator americanus]|uniref:Uncharacterized protein n=1 Tax=Necator americanus TaxID=51031 RepID=A0ABR1CFR1_NECAM